MRSILLPVFALSVTTGCQKIPDLSGLGEKLEDYKPTVAYERMDLGSVDFDGLSGTFVLSIDNPNPVALGLAGLSYDLDLEGHDLLAGDQDGGIQLAASSASEVELPFDITFSELAQLAGDLSGKEALAFALAGEVRVQTPVGDLAVPYSREGELPMVQRPKLSFDKIAVTDVSLLKQTAELQVDLLVEHGGGANLGLADFGYALELSGAQVASGTLAKVADLSVGDRAPVSLPITVQLVDLGASLVGAITNRERLNARLSGELEVETPYGALPLSLSTEQLVELL